MIHEEEKLLCRKVDVMHAISMTIDEFTQNKLNSLQSFIEILENELAKIELFYPEYAGNDVEELKKAIDSAEHVNDVT